MRASRHSTNRHCRPFGDGGSSRGMRLLFWYWGRRGAGGQLTLSLAEALARRSDTALALSLSLQADLLAETAALGLPTDAVDTYGSAAGFVPNPPGGPFFAARVAGAR